MKRALGVLALLLGWTLPAAAQVVRPFTPRFSVNQPGDITLIGNTIMSCNGGGGCTNARNGTGGSLNDNDFTMVYVDVDGVAATFSSSSAQLGLPPGAVVTWAGLYWGGESNNAARNQVLLTTPTAASATITATQVNAFGNDYQALADVTASVVAGGNGTYTVANVRSTPNAADKHGGWALVVVYRDATQPARNLVVFDGYANVSGTSTVTLTATGFVTPPAGVVSSRIGVVAYEGDLGFTGDAFQLNGTPLGDARNPNNNFFNSSISQLGATVTSKNPNYLNQLGFDIDLINATGLLPNGATSATITLNTNGDTYFPGVVTFTTDLYAPVFDASTFTKTVTDVDGGLVRPGDLLDYTVTMSNSGLDHAVGCVLRDTLPANVSYVAGSLQVLSGANAGTKSDGPGDDQMEYVAGTRTVVARIGTGADGATGGQMNVNATSSIRFRVRVTPPAPNGSVVRNQAALAFTGQQSGVAFASMSDGDPGTGGSQTTNVTIATAPFGGVVFEDVNYGGGAGRTRAAASGVVRPGAIVELYDATGAFLASDTTDAAGAYAFDGWPAGTYTLRAVNGTVTSSRPGAVAGLLPVQTFRTDATTGTAVAVADRVGGESPRLADAPRNTTAAPLASLTTPTTAAQSVTTTAFSHAALATLDFGFNFDTVVNANTTGQGSLRQFLVNAAALGNAGLAQVGQVAGVEASIFMVSAGAARPGLRAGLPSLLTAGVVRIPIGAALPVIADASTRIDGGTQTLNVGDTNPATFAGGLVGADDQALPALPAPEVEIRDTAGVALGLDVQAANATIAAVAVLGFGNTPANDAHADIRVGSTANGFTLDRCVIGTTATAFADPGAALRSGGDHVRAVGGDNGIVQASRVGWGGGLGLALVSGSNGWQIVGNEIREQGLALAAGAGIALESSASASVRVNRIENARGPAVDALSQTGGTTLQSNTFAACGTGGTVTPGVRVGGGGAQVDRNIVRDHLGAGVQVATTGTNVVITRNRISGNGASGAPPSGQIGIDLQKSGDDAARGTAPFVTLNDLNDVDTGANGLLNFPVISTAVVANGQFTITGWARPGSTIELFVAATDPSGFGEGATYVATFVEGSAQDLDATSSLYFGAVNGIVQGTDNTRRFRFTGAIPAGVFAGSPLTATATLTGTGTSEFSGTIVVTTGVAMRGLVYDDANHNFGHDNAEPGTGATLWAKLVPVGSGGAKQVVSVAPATGDYAFTFVNVGNYDVLVDDNDDPDDIAAARPAGWIGTQMPSGVRTNVAVAGTDVNGLDFGLWHGSRVDGVVFRDDGGASPASANDGARQLGEAALDAVRVRLTSSACASGRCDSTLSDGAGAFTLWAPFAASGLPAEVREVNPAGFRSTGGRAGMTGGTYSRAADGVAFTPLAGVEYGGVAFGDVPFNAFAPPGNRSVAAGGVAFHPHTFVAGSAGLVAFGASQSQTPPMSGWGVALYRDLDCDGAIDVGEPAVTGALAVSAGQSVCLVARHSSPGGAPAGAQSLATLTASFTYTGAVPALAAADSLNDLTTVLANGNGLVLTKSVDLASARPGDVITYTIRYENLGNAPLTNIVIRDATPAWTTFFAASCATLGAGLTGCTPATPAVGATGNVAWTLAGALQPGASGEVTFRVRVR